MSIPHPTPKSGKRLESPALIGRCQRSRSVLQGWRLLCKWYDTKALLIRDRKMVIGSDGPQFGSRLWHLLELLSPTKFSQISYWQNSMRECTLTHITASHQASDIL